MTDSTALERPAINWAAGSSFTPSQFAERAIHRRAVEAVNWGMPLVNYDLMFQAAVNQAGAAPNQIVYWSRLPDWKNQTLTPNPDAIYLMPFIDTQDGPVVLEIPPAEEGSITGTVMDCWQTAIEDVGPAGVDKGAGGKYLILPPGHAEAVPDGYIPMPSGNWNGYALLRSILKSGSDEDVSTAVAYGKRIRLYPFAHADNPPPTVWRDAVDVVFDSTIPYDLRFFRSLDRMIQREPWLERDKVMIDLLATIGIVKDAKFDPDPARQAILEGAISEAHAWQVANYDNVFIPPFAEGARWALPAIPAFAKAVQCNYTEPDSYPIDGRGLAYSYAFFSAKHLGAGQYYLMTIRDSEGEILHGSQTYRLRVPPNAPVRQYWSATLYDRATHAFIRDVSHPGRGSQSQGIACNADGSVDLFFGPEPPAGKDANWAPTRANGDFEVLFRLYGPEKAFFDKQWRLPDIEKLS